MVLFVHIGVWMVFQQQIILFYCFTIFANLYKRKYFYHGDYLLHYRYIIGSFRSPTFLVSFFYWQLKKDFFRVLTSDFFTKILKYWMHLRRCIYMLYYRYVIHTEKTTFPTFPIKWLIFYILQIQFLNTPAIWNVNQLLSKILWHYYLQIVDIFQLFTYVHFRYFKYISRTVRISVGIECWCDSSHVSVKICQNKNVKDIYIYKWYITIINT